MSESIFLNPKYKTLIINSRDLNQNNELLLDDEIEFSACRLSSFLFCNSYYNINDSNNQFRIIQKSNLNVIKPYTFQLTNGLYDSSTYITELQTKLNSAPPALSISGTFTVSVNPTTLRLTISNTDANNDFIVDEVANNHYDLIGFTTLSTVYGKTKSGFSSVNFSDNHTLLLRSDNLGIIFNDVKHSSFQSNDTLIHCAYNLSPPMSWVYSTPNSQSFFKINKHGNNPVSYINKIHLEVVDTNGKKIDFNNIPFYVQLEFM